MKKRIVITVVGGIAEIASNPTNTQAFILDWDNFKEDHSSIDSLSACGTCGSKETDDNGFCKNGHDDWVEGRDFFNPQLREHIRRACKNLNVTEDELLTHIICDD